MSNNPNISNSPTNSKALKSPRTSDLPHTGHAHSLHTTLLSPYEGSKSNIKHMYIQSSLPSISDRFRFRFHFLFCSQKLMTLHRKYQFQICSFLKRRYSFNQIVLLNVMNVKRLLSQKQSGCLAVFTKDCFQSFLIKGSKIFH